jgi:lipopolysaccharide biosynthesis glycosyltransferase
MNLEGLRNDKFLDKVRDLYPKIESQITWADQCLINKYAEGRKIILETRWNRQIKSFQTKEITFQKVANPRASSILHFTGGVKPWQAWCNPPISEYWWDLANELEIDGLKPTPITSVVHMNFLADVHDLNGRFEEASAAKTKVIQALSEYIEKLHTTGKN